MRMGNRASRSVHWAPWAVLAGLFGLQTIGSMGVMSIPPLVPFLRNDWNLGETQVGLFTSALYAGAAIASPVSGQLVDRFGVRHALMTSQLGVGVSILFLSLAPHRYWGLAVMFLAGIGYSTLNPATGKAIMYWFEPRVRGTAMSIKQMGVTVGSALAAGILPVLAHLSTWRTSLQLTGIVIIVLTSIWFLSYSDSGAELSSKRPPSLREGFSIIIENKNIMVLSLLMLLFTSVQLSLGTFLVIYLTDSIKLTAISAGGYLALAHLCGTVGRISWGVISDGLFKGARKPVLFLIGIVSAVAAFGLAFTSPDSPTWLLSLIVATFGFSAIGYNGVYLIYVAEIAGSKLAGVAIGVSLTISYLGIVLGTPFFGYLVEATSSYKVAWIGASASMAIAIWLLSFIKEEDSERRENKK